jgi:hypothetical protein
VKRLHSTTNDDFERALLSSAREAGPSPDIVRSVATALAAAAVTSAGASVASAPGHLTVTGKLAALSTGTKLAVVLAPLAIAGAVAGAFGVVDRSSPPDLVAAKPEATAPRAFNESQSPSADRGEEHSISPESLPVAELAVGFAGASSSQSAAPVAADAAESAPARPSAPSIAEEVRRLDQARSALASGRASDAIALVSAYERDFPRGALAREAQVVRIEAYAKLGQAAMASQLAAQFVARYPEDPHSPRLRGLVLPR